MLAEELPAHGDGRQEPEREPDLREEPGPRILERRNRLERDPALGDNAALEPARIAEVDEPMAALLQRFADRERRVDVAARAASRQDDRFRHRRRAIQVGSPLVQHGARG